MIRAAIFLPMLFNCWMRGCPDGQPPVIPSPAKVKFLRWLLQRGPRRYKPFLAAQTLNRVLWLRHAGHTMRAIGLSSPRIPALTVNHDFTNSRRYTMTEFYAQPCSLDHTGFYFYSIEKFRLE